MDTGRASLEWLDGTSPTLDEDGALAGSAEAAIAWVVASRNSRRSMSSWSPSCLTLARKLPKQKEDGG